MARLDDKQLKAEEGKHHLAMPSHAQRDSLLHSKSGFDDFRGLYNLALLALVGFGACDHAHAAVRLKLAHGAREHLKIWRSCQSHNMVCSLLHRSARNPPACGLGQSSRVVLLRNVDRAGTRSSYLT